MLLNMKNHKLAIVQCLGIFVIISILMGSCSAGTQVDQATETETLSPKITDLATGKSSVMPTASVAATNSLPATAFTNIPTDAPTALEPLAIDRKKVAFAVRDGVFVTNMDGTNAITISVKDSVGFDMIYTSPVWSPDGHWLAFIGKELRANQWIYSYSDIYLAKADGSEVKRLTHSPVAIKDSLSWSPIGNYLLYDAMISGHKDIYLIDVNNENDNRNITNSAEDETDPAWSPNGQKIAFLSPEISEDGKKYSSSLNVMNTDGTNRQRITGVEAWFGKIAWSPDGKQIVYRSAKGCGDLYVVDLDSGKFRLLSNLAGHKRSPAWSPDAKQILFAGSSASCSNDNGAGEAVFSNWQIYVINMDDGSQALLLPAQPSEENYDPAWASVPMLKTRGNYSITESGNNLYVRSSPSTKGKAIEKLQTGDRITVLDEYADSEGYYWRRIQTADNMDGWVVEIAAWYQAVE